MEKGVYDCDYSILNRVLYNHREFFISRRLYNLRVIRRHVPLGTIKHRNEISDYLTTLVRGQHCVSTLLE